MSPARSALDRCLAALPPQSLVLVAVSGGADSVYLLHLLADRLPALGHRVAVIHVNHGQRGADSDADALFVEELGRELGVNVYMERPAVPASAGEDMLREARLAAMKRAAKALGAAAVAFGHTLDDAAETFLLMALRGSGPHGLGSMTEVRKLSGSLLFLRPMLDMEREAVRAKLTKRGHSWREDASNTDVRFRRNALRRDAIPPLIRLEGHAIRQLARSAALTGTLSRDLTVLADAIVLSALRHCGGGTALFRLPDMSGFPPEPAAEVLRAMLRVYTEQAGCGTKPLLPGRALLTDIATHLVNPPREPSAFRLPQGVCIWLGREALLFPEHLSLEEALMRCRSALPVLVYQGPDFPLDTEGDHCLEGETLRVELLSGPPGALLPHLFCAGERVAWFDRDQLEGPLTLRRIRRSDRVELPDGTRKLATKVLQEHGVPAQLRTGCVAGLAAGKRLIWIPGIWRGPAARLAADSRHLMRLEWRPRTQEPTA